MGDTVTSSPSRALCTPWPWKKFDFTAREVAFPVALASVLRGCKGGGEAICGRRRQWAALWVTGLSLWQTNWHSSAGRKGTWYPWNFTLPGKVPLGPAKPTPALSGEQAAVKEFETPWSLAGSGGGPLSPWGRR